MMLDLRRLRLLRELNERGTIAAVADDAPGFRCELLESEPEEALPALALGDVDLVLGDEWHHQPRQLPEGVDRLDLLSDRVLLVLPARHAVARKHRRSVPLAELADDPWRSGHPPMGWEEVTQRVCRQHGGFDPDIRHRSHGRSPPLHPGAGLGGAGRRRDREGCDDAGPSALSSCSPRWS